MRIADLCTRAVVTCRRDTSALELAQLMRDRHVGDVIVVDVDAGGSTPVGIVTDRDMIVRIMAKDVDPKLVRAEDLITEELVTAVGREGVYDGIWHMRSKGIRRLPVVDEHNHLLGVLTADDVTQFLAEELTELAHAVPHQRKLEQRSLDPPAKP